MNSEYQINYLNQFGCEIKIKDDLSFDSALPENLHDYSKLLVITDQNVSSLYNEELKEAFGSHMIVLPAGEEGKTLEKAEECWRQMVDLGCDRRTLVIAVGGGMITDLAGFVAACYMRGVDYVSVPTTLLGMVDAAIGGKTAVNLKPHKNMVGAIHHPKRVLIAPNLLKSLPKRDLCSGLAEVIKYGVIWDASFFDELEQNMDALVQGDREAIKQTIARSCAIKAEIVAKDEKEHNIRAVLNFGHTFGHGIEAVTRYRRYLHGEAVSIGMCLAAKLSVLMGMCDRSVVEKIENLCQRAHLPTEITDVPRDQLIAMMSRDKKNIFGKFNLIVVEKIGKVVSIKDIDRAIIEKTVGG